MSIKYNPSTASEPSLMEHSTYYIADNSNLYEIQRSNNFEFVVTDIDNILKAGYDGTEEESTIKNAQEVLRMSVRSTSAIPHFNQKAITLRRGNNEVKYAGVPSFSSGNIVLNDYIGVQTKEALAAWQNLSYNIRTQKVGLASDYKKKCYLLEFTPDYQLVRKWVLYGCWISNMTEDSYDYESNDTHKVTVTIEYDKGEIDTSEDI